MTRFDCTLTIYITETKQTKALHEKFIYCLLLGIQDEAIRKQINYILDEDECHS